MYVHTTKAASLLNISPRRLLQILQQRRVKGAYKSGKFWLIPLYNGLPVIIEGKRGCKGTWKTTKKPRKTVVHINGHKIRNNSKESCKEKEPVIAIKGKKNLYAHQLEIPYPCRIVYQPNQPLSCGARVWIEVLGCDLELVQPPGNIAYI